MNQAGNHDAQVRRLQRPSQRSAIPSFMVMDLMDAAAGAEAKGQNVIHMEVGQPATPAPAKAKAAAQAAIADSKLGYTLALGMPELRARIARHYGEWYGIDMPASRIVITNGSSAAFVLTFLSIFDTGECVALPSPGYPCYRHILTTLGQRYEIVETGPQNRWMPTIDQIEAVAGRVAGTLIASPNNPTGTMLEPDRMAAIIETCQNHNIWFISDEIYHGLTYGQKAETALKFSDNIIVISSFSKYFSMTGWRVGWMVVPEWLIPTVERLAQNLFICAPAVAQTAALGAFESIEELERNRRNYSLNREILLDGLPKVGLGDLVPADGALYIYVNVGAYTTDSLAFSRRLLEETGIAATSGIDFDEARGGQYLRFSYAGTADDMHEAIKRLATWDGLKNKS